MLLAIDTTSSACSCALYAGEVIASHEHIEEKGHAELLIPQIQTLLEGAKRNIGEVKCIAVTTGPGSFTGVRVGIAAARGLALALNCKLVGLTSFEAMAATVTSHAGDKNFSLKAGDKFSIVFDARRDQVYTQTFIFEGGGMVLKTATEPQALDISEAIEMFENHSSIVVGGGAGLVGEIEGSYFANNDFKHILARNFCSYVDDFKLTEPSSQPTPLYLRAPDAKPSFSFLSKGL